MFGFLKSADRKMRENAANWLEIADKVWHYRRDVLGTGELAELEARTASLRAEVKARAGAEKLQLGIEHLEENLRRTGGAIYPKTTIGDNVEFFLVAALVILGLRTYVVQPFKIPTNSMWPTYNGMTPEAFTRRADEPGWFAQAARFVSFGAQTVRVDAPVGGEVLIPVAGSAGGRLTLPFREVAGRTWLVLPTTLKEYTLLVGDRSVTVRVPQDFDFEWAVRDCFFPNERPSHEPGGVDLARVLARQGGTEPSRVRFLRTGRNVKAGQRVMAFDILTGDQLFVDRMSYHFIPPAVGSGFVFRTGNIEGLARSYGDQYYIKRLVGVPGDTLEIKGFALQRNGAPITGAAVFAGNARQEGNHVGYRYEGLLRPGTQVKVGAGEYFALGDNSANSLDGRYWGTVPARDVVGRPILVYFPFTRHWGPAQ
jgi:signal peptidase I